MVFGGAYVPLHDAAETRHLRHGKLVDDSEAVLQREASERSRKDLLGYWSADCIGRTGGT